MHERICHRRLLEAGPDWYTYYGPIERLECSKHPGYWTCSRLKWRVPASEHAHVEAHQEAVLDAAVIEIRGCPQCEEWSGCLPEKREGM